MDVKDVLSGGGEGTLPTLEQNLSTGAVVAPAMPTITADAATYWKFAGGTIMGVAGALFLGYGKKNNDVQKMIIGAVLTFASVLLF